jgi:hypothetical protein
MSSAKDLSTGEGMKEADQKEETKEEPKVETKEETKNEKPVNTDRAPAARRCICPRCECRTPGDPGYGGICFPCLSECYRVGP